MFVQPANVHHGNVAGLQSLCSVCSEYGIDLRSGVRPLAATNLNNIVTAAMSVPAIPGTICAGILGKHAPIVARDPRNVCPTEFAWHAETLQSEKPYPDLVVDVQVSHQASTSSEIWKVLHPKPFYFRAGCGGGCW